MSTPPNYGHLDALRATVPPSPDLAARVEEVRPHIDSHFTTLILSQFAVEALFRTTVRSIRSQSRLRTPISIAMLTATGRAAARRVAPSTRAVACYNSSASLTPQIALRPAARSFTNSPRAPEVAAKPKKKTTTAAKKPKAKATAKKPAAKKPAAKKKVAPKKKTAVKPKPKKVVKKKRVITPEQKGTLQMREWKRTSLLSEEPKLLPISPFNIYIAEVAKGCEPGGIGKFATGYKDLPSAELNVSHSAIPPYLDSEC